MRWYPKRTGKTIAQRRVVDIELNDGKHVHSYSARDGDVCLGGNSECALWEQQLMEAMEDWTRGQQ